MPIHHTTTPEIGYRLWELSASGDGLHSLLAGRYLPVRPVAPSRSVQCICHHEGDTWGQCGCGMYYWTDLESFAAGLRDLWDIDRRELTSLDIDGVGTFDLDFVNKHDPRRFLDLRRFVVAVGHTGGRIANGRNEQWERTYFANRVARSEVFHLDALFVSDRSPDGSTDRLAERYGVECQTYSTEDNRLAVQLGVAAMQLELAGTAAHRSAGYAYSCTAACLLIPHRHSCAEPVR